MTDNKPFIGIIGGSGLYELEELINPKWIKVSSLFGEPSGEILIGELNKITYINSMKIGEKWGNGKMLKQKLEDHNSNIWLINTGWIGEDEKKRGK